MSHCLKTHLFTLILSTALLTACGGDESSPATATPADTFAPQLNFEPAALNVNSGETGMSVLSATDNIRIQTGPTISCTEGGLYSDSIFTAPDVDVETTSICTATATDPTGNTGMATLTVTIAAAVPNQAPTAEAVSSKSIIAEGQPFILDASNSSDPEGTPLEYNWSQIDGPDVMLTDSSNPVLSLNAPALDSDATLVFEVLITDGEDESRQSVSIDVEALDTLTIAGETPTNTNIHTSRIAGITAPSEGGFRTHWTTTSFTGTSRTASQLFDDMMQRIGPESSATIRPIKTPELGHLSHAVQSGNRTYYIHQTELHSRDQPLRRGFTVLSNRPEGEADSVGVLIADGEDTDVFPVGLAAAPYSEDRLVTAVRIMGRGDQPAQIDGFIHSPDGSQVRTTILKPTENIIRDVAVAQSGETGYLATWSQPTSDPEITTILGRLITEDGTKSQNTITISDPLGISYFPAMATLSDGRVLVIWHDGKDFAVNQTLSTQGRILQPDGTFATDIFTLHTTEQSGDVLGLVRATAMQDGQALVTWWSERREEIDETVKTQEVRIQSLAIGSNGEPVSNIFDIYRGQPESDEDVLLSIDDLQVAISTENRAVIGWNFRDFDIPENSFYSDFYPVGR